MLSPGCDLVGKKLVQITALTSSAPWVVGVEENFLTQARWREGGMRWWSRVRDALRATFLGWAVVTHAPAQITSLTTPGTSSHVLCNEVTHGKKQRQACKQAENPCPSKGKTEEQRNWKRRQSWRGKRSFLSYTTNQRGGARVKNCVVLSKQTVGKT